MNAVREEVQLEEFYKAGRAQRTFYDIDKECPDELERDALIIAKRTVSKISMETPGAFLVRVVEKWRRLVYFFNE
jgi:hypothetical protein